MKRDAKCRVTEKIGRGYNQPSNPSLQFGEGIASMRALLLEDDAAQRLTQYLLDQAGEGAFWADSDGRFFYVNEAACSMMGYTREEMLEMRVADILPPEKGTLFQELSRKVRQSGSYTFEVTHVCKDGRRFPA